MYFVTTNAGKMAEVASVLPWLVQMEDECDEVQGSPSHVAHQKALSFQQNNWDKHWIIEDTSLDLIALNGFPGPYIKEFEKKMGLAGICQLLKDKDRRATFRCIIARCTGDDVDLYEGLVDGTVPDAPRGDHGFGFDSIFVPDGQHKTLAEMSPDEKLMFSPRVNAAQMLRSNLSPDLVSEYEARHL